MNIIKHSFYSYNVIKSDSRQTKTHIIFKKSLASSQNLESKPNTRKYRLFPSS